MIHKIYRHPARSEVGADARDTPMLITIEALDDAQLSDAAAISEKARPFNARLHTYSTDELHQFQAKPDHHVLGVRIANRSLDLGLIGCLVCHAEEEDFVADSFIVADQFLGFGIEYAMVRALSDVALSCGCGAVVLLLAQSEDNYAARAFYDSLGLTFETVPSGELELAFPSLAADAVITISEAQAHRKM